ncbi:nitrate reductase molybdenum cofactor assembly chaperone [Arthrobacter sp. LS16]|uniref:Nitrate reductase molybdenum cofactor assembly chaperone n=1 Tax=Glutamicibacter soli TaxID=453836 RepID=A0A365YCT2_9MICC|nr:nitrate reductase molybdenum cofactor assembly chaperone [Glutamicibacter soli]RBM00177.1 nitrate reductase molybdenum cofactor assembly chaperone [Glutamicibacter soli]
MIPRLFNRATPTRPLPGRLEPVRMNRSERSRVHMLASLLLDYPDEAWFARLDELESHLVRVPPQIAGFFAGFIDAARQTGAGQLQRDYVDTFDLKRKCSLYLSYFATGDTRKRGTALVTFIEAYRAAGWDFEAEELPDYLPAVLEFSARSEDEIAEALLAAHVEGIEVLRAALEATGSIWAPLVRTITLSLPPVDAATQERVLALVSEGPPTETVGLSFLGNLPPFSPRGNP